MAIKSSKKGRTDRASLYSKANVITKYGSRSEFYARLNQYAKAGGMSGNKNARRYMNPNRSLGNVNG